MVVAFIMSKQRPQEIFEIKINPDFKDMEMLDHICEARGINNHMVVYLDNKECYNLSHYIMRVL